jgi:hypothetical protein
MAIASAIPNAAPIPITALRIIACPARITLWPGPSVDKPRMESR